MAEKTAAALPGAAEGPVKDARTLYIEQLRAEAAGACQGLRKDVQAALCILPALTTPTLLLRTQCTRKSRTWRSSTTSAMRCTCRRARCAPGVTWGDCSGTGVPLQAAGRSGYQRAHPAAQPCPCGAACPWAWRGVCCGRCCAVGEAWSAHQSLEVGNSTVTDSSLSASLHSPTLVPRSLALAPRLRTRSPPWCTSSGTCFSPP